MNRTDRLYALVEELRGTSPRPRTAAWLASRFEVSTRTVKRDISALQQAGVPIWVSIGPGGGYVLEASATLPPIAFTTGEALALAVALAVGQDLPFEIEGRSALQKVVGSMDDRTRLRFEEEASRVYVRETVVEPSPRAMRVIEAAVRAGTAVKMRYLDGAGTATERTIEPLAMGLDRDRWLIFAWCRLRADGRVFRLDRVQEAWSTRERIPERDLMATFGEIPADVVSVHRADRPERRSP